MLSLKFIEFSFLITFIVDSCISSEEQNFNNKENQQMLKQANLKDEDDFEGMLSNEFEKFSKFGYRSKVFNETIDAIKTESRNKKIQPRMGLSIKCLACRGALANLLLRRRLGEKPETLAKSSILVCRLVTSYSEQTCQGIVNLNIGIIIFIIDSRPKLTATDICSLILQGECGEVYESLNFHINISPPPSSATISKSRSFLTNKSFKILQITDIHYDQKYQPGSSAFCKAPICCRSDSGKPSSEKAKAGYWSDYRNCDTPWHAVEETVRAAADQHPDTDYVYFTGDYVDHAIWETSIESNTRSMDRINNLFKDVFQNKPVYSILGNHEAHPLNVFAPKKVEQETFSSQWLYNHSATIWSDWLPEGQKQTVLNGGYYTLLLRPKLRLIALNNNNCYIFNWWILYDIEDTIQQLQWLHDTLLEAETNGEKVHILAHIPSGNGDCFKYWSQQYQRIIERFHDTISAQFNGHSHANELNVFYNSQNLSNPINVAFNGGSITTFYDVNPNYNVYSVDSRTFQVNDFETWIYNITEANEHPNQSPNWFKLFSFTDAFNVTDTSIISFDSLLEVMSKDRNLSNKYYQHKFKSGDPFIKAKCDDNCLKLHLCQIVVTKFGDDRKCNELKSNSFV